MNQFLVEGASGGFRSSFGHHVLGCRHGVGRRGHGFGGGFRHHRVLVGKHLFGHVEADLLGKGVVNPL